MGTDRTETVTHLPDLERGELYYLCPQCRRLAFVIPVATLILTCACGLQVQSPDAMAVERDEKFHASRDGAT